MTTRRTNASMASSKSTNASRKTNGVLNGHADPKQTEEKAEKSLSASDFTPNVSEIYAGLSMVFGGCCSNVLIYEQLLIMNPRIGSALTFAQMLFVTMNSLPSFVTFSRGILPRLKPRQVPLSQWALQVMVLTTGSLLNNWAFAYNVPLTILIVFRSAGLPVSMFLGYTVMKKRYSLTQVLAIMLVTVGVTLVTLSKSSGSTSSSKVLTPEETTKYFIGIAMMSVSLFCTGFLGLLQERTYSKYGPCWREGVFYTHFLALPAFLFLGADVKQGIFSLYNATSTSSSLKSFGILLANLITQLNCVQGVNKLSSQVSSVSTNIALTARKALSLCLSVWLFGNEWNSQLGIGAFMVFFGSLIYTLQPSQTKKVDLDAKTK